MKNRNCKMFENFYTNKPGIWYFIPKDSESYKKNSPCKGFGQIKYGEGSLYTGEIYFDGKNYHKQGYGQQDFTYSSIGSIDQKRNEKKYLFIGKFDYKKTNWIHGNGILYYRDKDGNPLRFVKGFFSNLSKINEYQGEFDYSLLINGYTKEMESEFVEEEKSLIKFEMDMLNDIENPDTLFIGDSYFEFWHYKNYVNDNSFTNIFDSSKYLNIGVGGTRFKDWIKFHDELKHLPKFKNIVVNLGFNDLHHSFDTNPNTIYNDFLTFLNLYRQLFKDANFYFLTVCHSPAYFHMYKNEVRFNNLIKRNSKNNNIVIIDNSSIIALMQKSKNCFDLDNVHLNSLGYSLMHNEIIKNVK